MKLRVKAIAIEIQEGYSFGGSDVEFDDAIEFITYYWKTKSFLPAFGDSIYDDHAGVWMVTGRSLLIDDQTITITVMEEMEFLTTFFRDK